MKRDRRDLLGFEGNRPHGGLDAHGGPRRAREREPRVRAARVERDDVADMQAIGVLDLVAVHAPDVGPSPRVFQELAGDVNDP